MCAVYAAISQVKPRQPTLHAVIRKRFSSEHCVLCMLSYGIEHDVRVEHGVCALRQGMDLVIHCAGPFQWKEECAVLEAAIAAGTPYIDVCDDADYSKVRMLHLLDCRANVQHRALPLSCNSSASPPVS